MRGVFRCFEDTALTVAAHESSESEKDEATPKPPTLAAAIKTYVGTRGDHRSRMLLHATQRLADQADVAAAAAPADLPTVLAAFEDVRVALIRAREQAWDDYFDRENPQPMDERIGNEASLARMTALGAVEAVCYQLARAAGEVDNLGLPKVERKAE